MGYAVITSTSAYFAACAAATHPLIRTVFFFARTVAMIDSVCRRIEMQPRSHENTKKKSIDLLRDFASSWLHLNDFSIASSRYPSAAGSAAAAAARPGVRAVPA